MAQKSQFSKIVHDGRYIGDPGNELREMVECGWQRYNQESRRVFFVLLYPELTGECADRKIMVLKI